ncbi:Gfo/Idh/MocA family protein [Halalkalibacter kiskunsagensis]|uniref:Gfo/Idh/MocA family protein n=1 Tax=Halalkalibacter kiskunsagensis TaxID=1548599 RepID=A0ABV6KAV7_9BACI
MKIGIISFAHMHALSYARCLLKHPQAELVSIWDNNQDRGNKMAREFTCDYYDDLDLFLKSNVEAVIVCSENANHKEHVLSAARAKKHILCEKPIATEINDAKEMIQTCEQEGIMFQIAFPVRFSPAILEAYEIITSGAIGEVMAINATNHGQMPGGWFIEKELSGGGAATDHIVHLMDVIRWFLKDEVKNVYAELDTRFYDIEVEDCGMVSIELQSGVIVSIDPSWSRPATFSTWGDVKMEILGTKGSLSIDALKQSSLYFNDADGKVQDLFWGDDMDKGLIDDFINNVLNDLQPSITGEDGLRALEVVKAAYESNEHQQVVTLT